MQCSLSGAKLDDNTPCVGSTYAVVFAGAVAGKLFWYALHVSLFLSAAKACPIICYRINGVNCAKAENTPSHWTIQ